MRRLVLFVCVALMVVSGNSFGFAAEQHELIVSAAASLTNALTEIGKAFEETESINIVFNFASSGELLKQMEQGAPVDVFASANLKFMDDAATKKLIDPATRQNFTQNSLVLAVPANTNISINAIGDLAAADVQRIAIGDPASVPAGQYAKESLEGYGVWKNVVDRLVYGNTVRQVLDYLRRGEVDAGIVFSTDAALEKETVNVVMELELKTPVLYPIAVTTLTEHKEAAARFVEFVISEKGQEILGKFGFVSMQ